VQLVFERGNLVLQFLLETGHRQRERLERMLRHELKRVERFKRLIGKRRPTLIVLDLFDERFG
jgi:hypothetical protein